MLVLHSRLQPERAVAAGGRARHGGGTALGDPSVALGLQPAMQSGTHPGLLSMLRTS